MCVWRAGRIKKIVGSGTGKLRQGKERDGRKDRKIKTGKGRDSQKAMIPKVLKDYKGKEREAKKTGI